MPFTKDDELVQKLRLALESDKSDSISTVTKLLNALAQDTKTLPRPDDALCLANGLWLCRNDALRHHKAKIFVASALLMEPLEKDIQEELRFLATPMSSVVSAPSSVAALLASPVVNAGSPTHAANSSGAKNAENQPAKQEDAKTTNAATNAVSPSTSVAPQPG